MKLHFLGTGAADWDLSLADASQDFRRNSSLLIDDRLLIDPGACLFEFEKTFGYTGLYAGVSDIVNTHPHSDHWSEEPVRRVQRRQDSTTRTTGNAISSVFQPPLSTN